MEGDTLDCASREVYYRGLIHTAGLSYIES